MPSDISSLPLSVSLSLCLSHTPCSAVWLTNCHLFTWCVLLPVVRQLTNHYLHCWMQYKLYPTIISLVQRWGKSCYAKRLCKFMANDEAGQNTSEHRTNISHTITAFDNKHFGWELVAFSGMRFETQFILLINHLALVSQMSEIFARYLYFFLAKYCN